LSRPGLSARPAHGVRRRSRSPAAPRRPAVRRPTTSRPRPTNADWRGTDRVGRVGSGGCGLFCRHGKILNSSTLNGKSDQCPVVGHSEFFDPSHAKAQWAKLADSDPQSRQRRKTRCHFAASCFPSLATCSENESGGGNLSQYGVCGCCCPPSKSQNIDPATRDLCFVGLGLRVLPHCAFA